MSTLTEETTSANLSGLQLLPWAKIMLDYTDAVIGSLPEDDAELDWRPSDAAATWYFSPREQAMHIVDERHDALSWITGDSTEGKMFLKEYGGTGKPWEFKPATREQILESCKAGRIALNQLLSKPHHELLETTDKLREEHQRVVAKLREDDKDEEADIREARGPGRIINTVLFIISHEQSHRSVLQHMLRLRGHEVVRYA
jgi:hypothetical protein